MVKILSNNLSKIQSVSSIEQVLGSICQNPNLILESNLEPTDFVSKFHKIVFAVLNNLARQGYQTIDILAINEYLQGQPQALIVYQEAKGDEEIQNMVEKALPSNFEANVKMVKKFSLLRDLYQKGIDISSWYDFETFDPNEIAEQNSKLFNTDIKEVIDDFMVTVTDITTPYMTDNEDVEEFDVDAEIDDVLSDFEKGIEVGIPFYNKGYTSAFYGMRKNNLLLESAGSGVGKSRRQIREAVHLSIPFIFDRKENKWIDTGIVPLPTLYISTELSKPEVISIMVAYLTGINSRDIKFNRLSDTEKALVRQAKKLIKKYKSYLKVVLMPNYDTNDIISLLKRYILKFNIRHFFFDYIHETEKLLGYYTKKTGSSLRPDQMLFLLCVSLKSLCKTYDVFIWTSTQLNQDGMSGDVLDARALRGAKSIADKVDFAIIVSKLTEKDMKKLEPILEQQTIKGYGEVPVKPNRRTCIYKNRDGEMVDIFLWSRMDLGTCREELLFATTNTYEPITYELLTIEMKQN